MAHRAASPLRERKVRYLLVVLCLISSTLAFAGFECEAIKVIGVQAYPEGQSISIALTDSNLGPNLKMGEFEGLSFEARYIPDNIMFPETMMVSIKKGNEVFSSNGSKEANVVYTQFDPENQETVLYGISCSVDQ